MKNNTTTYLLLVFLCFTIALDAQEKQDSRIELPEKSLEYKVNRGLGNTMSWFYSGIAYAKSKGDTPEDFASYGLNAWKSWWDGKDIPAYLRKFYICFSIDKDFKMEILNETENSAEVRVTIFGKSWMSTFEESGVTDDEYIRFIGAMFSSMAEYLGFNYNQKFEQDWIYFTVSEMSLQ